MKLKKAKAAREISWDKFVVKFTLKIYLLLYLLGARHTPYTTGPTQISTESMDRWHSAKPGIPFCKPWYGKKWKVQRSPGMFWKNKLLSYSDFIASSLTQLNSYFRESKYSFSLFWQFKKVKIVLFLFIFLLKFYPV